MTKLLYDKRVYRLQERVDRDLAKQAEEQRCEHCGEKLHRGDFSRKPRGPATMMGWDSRYSFDCSACRKRKTPPSVRFLGRKVYVGVVVVLVAAMMHGESGRRIAVLHEALGIDERTLKRWRQWWLEVFVQTPFWRANKARFMPVLKEAVMPYCLVEAFDAQRREGLLKLMEFLSPITTTSGKGVVAM